MEDNPYFTWIRCPKCRAYFPAPKFLKNFLCPTCGKPLQWKEIWYKPMEGFRGPNEIKKMNQK